MSPVVGLLLVLLLVVIWYVLTIANEARVAGYWGDAKGGLYRIYPLGGSGLVLETASGLYGAVPGARYPVRVGPLGMAVALPHKRLSGWTVPDVRRIKFGGGKGWVRQRA
jgi:hypothetical protein